MWNSAIRFYLVWVLNNFFSIQFGEKCQLLKPNVYLAIAIAYQCFDWSIKGLIWLVGLEEHMRGQLYIWTFPAIAIWMRSNVFHCNSLFSHHQRDCHFLSQSILTFTLLYPLLSTLHHHPFLPQLHSLHPLTLHPPLLLLTSIPTYPITLTPYSDVN